MTTPTISPLLRLLTSGLILVLAGCARENPTFSLLSDSQSFKQEVASVNNKIDVLWVVDNSGSMTPLQTAMTNNFNSFISNFITKGYDFNIAVTTTDAYLADPKFDNYPLFAKFRDGAGSRFTGVFVIDPLTPNLVSTFVTNASQGQSGSGDERAFSSIKAALESTLNPSFPRPGAFLAVVILSDEDDFSSDFRVEGSWTLARSNPDYVADHDYTYAKLEPVANYVSYLDTKTNSTANKRNYNVSALTILDSGCLNTYRASSPGAIIGQRYIDLANQTYGVLGSVCDASFAQSLNNIQQNVLELSTQFFLTRIPVEKSIQVLVNGSVVPKSTTNGWTYNAQANSIMFHGSAVPQSGATINVSFDPTTVL